MVRYILFCLSFDFDLCHFFFTCSLLNFNDTSKHSLVSWILLLLFFFFFFFFLGRVGGWVGVGMFFNFFFFFFGWKICNGNVL